MLRYVTAPVLLYCMYCWDVPTCAGIPIRVQLVLWRVGSGREALNPKQKMLESLTKHDYRSRGS